MGDDVQVSRLARLLGPVLAALLALAACGGPAVDASDPAARDRAGAAASRPVDLGFTVTTVDGATFDGTSLAGKPAVLWFWAPWCPTCAVQAPQVTKLAERYDGRIGVIGVAGLDDLAAMHRFLDVTKVHGITHLADEQGVVWRRFGVTAQSTFVLLDSSGAIIYRGYLNPDDLDRRLAELAS
jgi:thiol-disulfide isomerase/thioredoxin